jgi:alanine-synthesizing transaminase
MYQSRRDVMIDGMHKMGWMAEKPKASMFIWAEIPDDFKSMGSLEFSKRMMIEGGVSVSPGVGFGDYGDDYVRIALIENEQRSRQALRGMQKFLHAGA